MSPKTVNLFVVIGVIIAAIVLGITIANLKNNEGGHSSVPSENQDYPDILPGTESRDSEPTLFRSGGIEGSFGLCEALADSKGLLCPISVTNNEQASMPVRFYNARAVNSVGSEVAAEFEVEVNGALIRESEWTGQISAEATRKLTLVVTSRNISIETFQKVELWMSTPVEEEGIKISHNGPGKGN